MKHYEKPILLILAALCVLMLVFVILSSAGL